MRPITRNDHLTLTGPQVSPPPFARLAEEEEREIVDIAEEASRPNAQAAENERRIATEAELIVRSFVGQSVGGRTNRMAGATVGPAS